MTAAVDVSQLEVRYQASARPAVSGLSLRVETGEVFGLLGPNGAGKSTTQRVLTRLLQGYRGSARVLGRPLERWDRTYYDAIGVSFELPAFYGKLTARENLQAFASLYGVPTRQPSELLERLDLTEAADRRARTLSKGMAMRLNLARALLHSPQLLFLDEPTSGLDPVHVELVREIIRAEARRGCTVFLTTHDMHTAEAVCDRVAFLCDGRLARLDTPRRLKALFGRRAVTVEHTADGAVQRSSFDLDGLAEDARFFALLRSGTVQTIHTQEASLDQVFAAVTGIRL